MICINFRGGALGHMVLNTIYHHWPKVFVSRMSTDAEKVQYTNHRAMPWLFLSNESYIGDSELIRLNQASDQDIILCHNAALIPVHIRQKITFINILSSSADLPVIAFLFMCKSGDFVFEWARKKQQQNFDFYEIVFQEFVRLAAYKFVAEPGTDLNFSELGHYQTVLPVIDKIQQKFDLDAPTSSEQWYIDNYNRSMQPLTQYREYYTKFKEFFDAIVIKLHNQTPLTYQSTVPSIDDFKLTVDFICNLFDKYSYAGEHACNEKFNLSVTQPKTQCYK
jgi:hypothetical protein